MMLLGKLGIRLVFCHNAPPYSVLELNDRLLRARRKGDLALRVSSV